MFELSWNLHIFGVGGSKDRRPAHHLAPRLERPEAVHLAFAGRGPQDGCEEPEMRHGTKVAVVTGATGAIGKAIARQLAEQQDFEVIVACRDAGKGQRAVAEIQKATSNPAVRYELVDVARLEDIRAFVRRLAGQPVDVLINNAAVAPRRREETSEGIEVQFATNVLGYLWMIQQLSDNLRRVAPSRVVNVASYWAGGLVLADLQFQRRPYNNDAAYRQSKQADRMLTVALAERLASDGISVNACHSGDVNSTLSNSLGFGGSESPDRGARTPVWLATEDIGQRATGRYFEHEREVPCRFGRDRQAVEALYETCLTFC